MARPARFRRQRCLDRRKRRRRCPLRWNRFCPVTCKKIRDRIRRGSARTFPCLRKVTNQHKGNCRERKATCNYHQPTIHAQGSTPRDVVSDGLLNRLPALARCFPSRPGEPAKQFRSEQIACRTLHAGKSTVLIGPCRRSVHSNNSRNGSGTSACAWRRHEHRPAQSRVLSVRVPPRTVSGCDPRARSGPGHRE